MKKIQVYAMVIVLTLVGAVFAIEVVMRLGGINPTFNYLLEMDFKIFLDESILYKVKPNSAEDINGQGYRDNEFHLDKRKGVKRIAFLGDSFIMGMTTPSKQTIPNKLEEILSKGGRSADVMNMGVYGYGPDQSIIQLKNEVFKYNPDLVILGLFPANDFNDIMNNNLFATDNKNDLALTPTSSNIVQSKLPFLKSIYLYNYLLYKYNVKPMYFLELFTSLHKDTPDVGIYYDTESTRKKVRLMFGVMREFKKITDDKKVPLLAVIVPYGPFTERLNYSGRERFKNENFMEMILNKEGIKHISLHKVLLENKVWSDMYMTGSGGEHFDAQGHEIVAQIIAKYINDNKIINF